MVSLEALVAAVTILSALILLSNFLVTYIHFRASTLGDAATREQVMRERHKTMTVERDMFPKREIRVSEPRVRDWGFKQWVKSLLPRKGYPGYTHFNITVRHTDWPDIQTLAEADYKPTFEYPTEEDLSSNDKLEKLGVFHVQNLTQPQWEGNGAFIIVPVASYRLYIEGADPDNIETIQESIRDIILEMEREEEERVILEQDPKSKEELKASRNT